MNENTKLEFKRQFFLQNLLNVKNEWYKFDEQREKFRFLFLSVWFGTVAIYIQANKVTWSLSILLLIITLVFFVLEEYLSKASKMRLRRISVMEHWLMSKSDDEILNHVGPLAVLQEVREIDKNYKLPATAFWQGKMYILYIVFLGLSILLKYIFEIIYTFEPLIKEKCCC